MTKRTKLSLANKLEALAEAYAIAAHRERLDDALYESMFGPSVAQTEVAQEYHSTQTTDALREAIRGVRLANDPSAARAHALLMRLLTPEQRQEYEASGTITLYSGTGATQRKFELRYSDLQVKVYDHEGRLFENWCGYVPNAPREDTLVAQLLAIRTDPARLRRAARVTSYHARPGSDLNRPLSARGAGRTWWLRFGDATT